MWKRGSKERVVKVFSLFGKGDCCNTQESAALSVDRVRRIANGLSRYRESTTGGYIYPNQSTVLRSLSTQNTKPTIYITSKIDTTTPMNQRTNRVRPPDTPEQRPK